MNIVATVHIWADDTWCESEDLEEYLGFLSDDYETLQVSYEDLSSSGSLDEFMSHITSNMRAAQ